MSTVPDCVREVEVVGGVLFMEQNLETGNIFVSGKHYIPTSIYDVLTENRLFVTTLDPLTASVEEHGKQVSSWLIENGFIVETDRGWRREFKFDEGYYINHAYPVDRNLTTSCEDVEECLRCQGSGEIGVDIRGRFERAGPVPDDAKGFAIATCWNCKGTGYIEKVS